MLSIIYDKRDTLVNEYHMMNVPHIVFEFLFDKMWLEEDWIRRELMDVEKFPPDVPPLEELLNRNLTFMGLAGGTRTLLLARNTDYIIDFSRMGGNCYPYLMEIADMRDVTVGMTRLYAEFDDNVIKGRTIKIVNNGKLVNSAHDVWNAGFEYL